MTLEAKINPTRAGAVQLSKPPHCARLCIDHGRDRERKAPHTRRKEHQAPKRTFCFFCLKQASSFFQRPLLSVFVALKRASPHRTHRGETKPLAASLLSVQQRSNLFGSSLRRNRIFFGALPIPPNKVKRNRRVKSQHKSHRVTAICVLCSKSFLCGFSFCVAIAVYWCAAKNPAAN